MAEPTSTRRVPMQVLALGLPRTGTSSMQAALSRLGYNDTYHGFDMLSRPQDIPLWERASDAKFYGQGEPLTRSEWDMLLGRCAAVTDMPCACFADELIEAYPEAKVVLVQRDVESWHKSFAINVIGNLFSRTANILVNYVEPLIGSRTGIFCRRLLLGYFRASSGEEILRKARAEYLAHYEHIRDIVPPERLLEYKLGTGWGPLCEFLGKEEPQEEFPRLNEEKVMREKMIEEQKKRFLAGSKQLAIYVGPVVVVGVAAYMFSR